MSKGTIPTLPEGYADWVTQLKGDITQPRQRQTAKPTGGRVCVVGY